MTSVSTRFLGQPRLTKPTFMRKEGEACSFRIPFGPVRASISRMVMYTVHVIGEPAAGRAVTLVFQTNEGETKNQSKTDRTGVASMWGPWSNFVRVLVDNRTAVEQAEWTERPADRFVEVSAPG